MVTNPDMDEHLASVRARLDRVTDPELDEPVTELGFVTGLAADDVGVVTICFRLPTYWCAANFAFMMADDMRREVEALPWVSRVDVTLDEHMYGNQINHAVSHRISFQDAFGSDAEGNLDVLRRTFLIKAFQRRQEALLRHLLDLGVTAEPLTGLTIAALKQLAVDGEAQRLASRYLDRRDVIGPARDIDLAFVDADGVALRGRDIGSYLQDLRRVGINAEFNGALCKALLVARYGDAQPTLPAEPTLIDFIRAGSGVAASRRTV